MAQDQPRIRKGRKFDQVIEGARDVFLRDGFEGANVDDIARAAGVSKATLYSYFPDKRSLFIEMARGECERQAEEAMQQIDLSAPPAAVLRKAGRRLVAALCSEFGHGIFRICVAEADRFPELGQTFYSSGPGLVRESLAHYLRMAVARGELAIDDIMMAADQFAELCKARYHPRVIFGLDTCCPPADADRIIDEAVLTFLARYGTRPGNA